MICYRKVGNIIKRLDNKTLSMKWVELNFGKEVEDLLHDLYIEQGKSIREIASEINVHYHTVNKWLKLIGIDMRLPHQKMLEMIDIKLKLKEKSENE